MQHQRLLTMVFACNLQLLSSMLTRVTLGTIADNLIDQKEFPLSLWWIKANVFLSESTTLRPSMIIF